MVKIIKNTQSEPTEITCPACLSVLSYTYQDIERVEEATLHPIGFRAIKRFIICPVCKRDIDLAVNKVKEAKNDRSDN